MHSYHQAMDTTDEILERVRRKHCVLDEGARRAASRKIGHHGNRMQSEISRADCCFSNLHRARCPNGDTCTVISRETQTHAWTNHVSSSEEDCSPDSTGNWMHSFSRYRPHVTADNDLDGQPCSDFVHRAGTHGQSTDPWCTAPCDRLSSTREANLESIDIGVHPEGKI